MKLTFLALCLLCSPVVATAQGPQVRFAIAVHSEEPGGGSSVPVTPNFSTASKLIYVQWREALLSFAQLCSTRALPWQLQPDYNFLEGVRRFETSTGANYDPLLLTNTAGKNVIKYLRENLGVNLDPHSHEGGGYNYADIAWLIDVALDTEPTGVVGGHVYTGMGYQNWPKFVEDTDGNGSYDGLLCAKYSSTAYRWKPTLLMGGGTANHRDDPHASGLWFPSWDVGTTNASATQYFTHKTSSPPGGRIAAIGTWEQDLHECDRLLGQLEAGIIPHDGRLWTMGHVFNHRDMVQPGFLTSIMPAQLDTIRRWRDVNRVTVAKFADILAEWNGASTLYRRPEDNASFSLNWQDLTYPEESAAELRTLLNAFEAHAVPVDVFFTTWQTDAIQAVAPEIIGRLQSSSRVTMGYHVRAPKPYASIYGSTNWFTTLMGRPINAADIQNYEEHGLDLATGLPTTSEGGYLKLTNLMGYAPRVVGANASTTTATFVHSYFNTAGAGMLVEHRSTAINLGEVRNGLYLRPESFDWILIEHFRGDVGATGTLTQALANARSASGATAPYFTGIKLHDNDLFANQSAWTHIYTPANRPRPYDPTAQAGLLPDAERTLRRAYYLDLIAEVASRQEEVNLISVRDALSLLAEEEARPVGLSFTEVDEGLPAGSVLAGISGGGVESGIACDYALENGAGGEDNADFLISGGSLLSARPLDQESDRVKTLRVRWTDGGGNTGVRNLTLVLRNVLTDDDDNDGFTEAQEQIAGTDPLSAASRLAVTQLGLVLNQVAITWFSVAGKQYQVDSSADLIHWTPVSGALVTADGSTTNCSFPSLGGRQFYQVRVVTP